MQPITIRAMTANDIQPCAEIVATTPLWQRYNVTQESAAEKLSEGLQYFLASPSC